MSPHLLNLIAKLMWNLLHLNNCLNFVSHKFNIAEKKCNAI